MRQVRGHSSAVTLLVYSHYRKLVIIVYKVINMDGCTFLGFKISCTIHSHYKGCNASTNCDLYTYYDYAYVQDLVISIAL